MIHDYHADRPRDGHEQSSKRFESCIEWAGGGFPERRGAIVLGLEDQAKTDGGDPYDEETCREHAEETVTRPHRLRPVCVGVEMIVKLVNLKFPSVKHSAGGWTPFRWRVWHPWSTLDA